MQVIYLKSNKDDAEILYVPSKRFTITKQYKKDWRFTNNNSKTDVEEIIRYSTGREDSDYQSSEIEINDTEIYILIHLLDERNEILKETAKDESRVKEFETTDRVGLDSRVVEVIRTTLSAESNKISNKMRIVKREIESQVRLIIE